MFGKSKGVSPKVTENQNYLKKHGYLQGDLDVALNSCLEAQGKVWPEEFDALKYIEAALRVMPVLKANLPILTFEELRLASDLVAAGQNHLFASWPPAGKQDADKKRFFAQVAQLNAKYPGGLKAYHTNAVKLLAEAKEGKNPLEGWTPEVPSGERVSAGSPAFLAFEKAGMDVVGQTAFVLVAGGLGERLGYNGIKIALPVDSVTGKSFMQWYAEYILAFQARACRGGKVIHLAIMTSDDTHAKTVDFLSKNANFGLKDEQLHVMKQEKVPSLVDNSARFALESKDAYSLETKPHGHGDVHSLLYHTGLVQQWKKLGVKYVAFFQDTNALTFRALPAVLGVSVKNHFDYNSLTVPRKAGEAVGGIAKLTRTDGTTMTLNVEYNQLDPLLRATVNEKGDVPDETGNSPFPGNINVLVLELTSYHKTLEATDGLMPEFVNPKYKDKEKEKFTKPTRLECMMQDYPKLLPSGSKVGFTQIDRWLCFSPVKNNVEDAAKKAAAGTPPESASTGEADMYNASAEMLRRAGMNVEYGPKAEPLGIPVTLGPQVHLAPSFATTWFELMKKVKGGSISATSSLVVEGDCNLKNLELDGALVLKPCGKTVVKIDGLRESNKGWELVPLEKGEKAPEEIAMRGYKLVQKWSRTLAYADGKEHTIKQ
mmetsp:Transcript_8573/g.25264  ORF Transcript_8573/g.25264 Transcript_8573/m.25264 type:complete len:657 (-) Transcript_8573:608-2578(-)